MSMQLPSSSSSSSSDGFKFDVFISFRGPDTRYGFTGNLYKALCNKGIYTFIDDEELQRGDEITPSLLKSIEDSRIAVIVFSKSYASSSFCLDELAHIIHYFKAKGRVVLPVFYDVDPSQVRHQNDGYGEALAKHEDRFQNNKKNMERLLKWRKALKQAADLSGYHFNLGKEYEHNFIEKIVKDVSNKINHIPLHVADYPVGLEPRMLEVSLLLDLGSSDGVCIIGIHGTGGIGKTTLARAVYNLIANQFEGLCFLHNVREKSTIHGLEHLQEQLLSKTIGMNITIGHASEGIPFIKQRLSQKKVLLILDDVDKLEQLRSLVGEPNWLDPGSKHLMESHGMEVTYASGLPLAIEVVGSNFSGMHISKWKSTLDKYERIPDKGIQHILKVSYDALDEEEKSVFLDIACCLKGYRLVEVEEILHAHYGYYIENHVVVLVDKSLIKITFSGIVTLHDLIENMGKEIVRQESPKESGERSRLWFRDDIVHVLKENTGTRKIEMIHLNSPSIEAVVVGNEKAFEKMTNLKTLIIGDGHVFKGAIHLPSSLRILKWNRCPFQSISSSILNKKFDYMKALTLDHCQDLIHIPNVSGLPNLKKFSFQNCKNLITIHNSFGNLHKLEIVVVNGCNKLESFPPLRLPSLKELKLTFCESLKSFPELLCKMTNIKQIWLRETSIGELPFSFQYLSELRGLHIYEGRMFRFPKYNDKMYSIVFSNLEFIDLASCNLSDECLRVVLTWCANVKWLDLTGNNFKILPECLNECHLLTKLTLDECESLEEIRGIPPNLYYLSAMECVSLSSSSRKMLLSQKLNEAGCNNIRFPKGREGIPDWFEHKIRGHKISFWFRKKIPSITFILLFSEYQRIPDVKLFVNVCGDFLNYQLWYGGDVLDSEHAFLSDIKLEEKIKLVNLVSEMDKALLENEWIHVELKLTIVNDISEEEKIKILLRSARMGIHVLKEKSNTEEDVIFTNPYTRKRKLDEYLNYNKTSLSEFEPPLKKQRLVEVGVSETEI